MMTSVFWILCSLVLVFINAFFVAAEFAMVKLRHTRVQILATTTGLRGRILVRVHKQLDAYLSACQVGITLASLGLGWIGEPAFSRLFHSLFISLDLAVAPGPLKIISFFIAFLIISFLHIVVGELMPKSYAIRQAESVSLWTSIPLYGFYWAMYPSIWLLNTCSNLLLRLTRLHHASHTQNIYSTHEIKLILNASRSEGELTHEETEIIEHTLDFADLKISEVMRPKTEMIQLDIRKPVEQILNVTFEHRYSRYPVYDSVKKKIIGIVHIKDLFGALYQGDKKEELLGVIRPVLNISHRSDALELLYKFREGTSHFALIHDDKKRIIGFVTMDNLLHLLIGRVKDEFHKTHDSWVIHPDGTLQVKGSCSLAALEKVLQVKLTQGSDKANTLAGFILNHAGVLPKAGERLSLPEFDVMIDAIQGTRITSVTIYPK